MDLHCHHLVYNSKRIETKCEMKASLKWLPWTILHVPFFSTRHHGYNFFCCFFSWGYYPKVAFILLESPCTYINDSWIRYIHVQTSHTARLRTMEQFALLGRHSTSLQLNTMQRLIDTGSSTHSLSVLLSAMETSCRTQTALALAWWSPLPITCSCASMLVTDSIWGRYSLFCSEPPISRWLFEYVV